MDIQRSMFLADSLTPSFDWVVFAIMLIFIILSAFFSMSETAFSSASVVKLRSAVEDRKRGAKKALALADNFEKTVTCLLIGNNIVNVGLSTIAVGFFSKLVIFNQWLDLASTLIVTLVLLIFGEILPKTFAKNNPEVVAAKVSFIIYILSIIFSPFIFFFSLLQRLLSNKRAEEDSKTLDEDELAILIEEMEEKGAIEDDEAELIKKVFDLKDRNVEDIMVPRIQMAAINYASTLEEVKQFLMDHSFSRVPVFKNDKDHVVGILYERDFFPAIIKNPKMSWKKLIRPVKFVSGQMKVDDLIVEFQNSKTHLAIVSGEYGDVLGLVTMEDALEELVGEIYDEHDIAGQDDLFFEKEEDGSYLIDAEMYVEDLFDRLNIGDIPEDVPSKLSGWLFAKCESIPEVGFSMKYVACYTMLNEESENYDDYAKTLIFSIAEVDGRRIHRIKVEIRDATEEEIEEQEQEDE